MVNILHAWIFNSTTRLFNSNFRLDHLTFWLDHWTFLLYHSTFRLYHLTFRLNNSTFRLNNSTFRLDHSTFRLDHSTQPLDFSTQPLDFSTRHSTKIISPNKLVKHRVNQFCTKRKLLRTSNNFIWLKQSESNWLSYGSTCLTLALYIICLLLSLEL